MVFGFICINGNMYVHILCILIAHICLKMSYRTFNKLSACIEVLKFIIFVLNYATQGRTSGLSTRQSNLHPLCLSDFYCLTIFNSFQVCCTNKAGFFNLNDKRTLPQPSFQVNDYAFKKSI